MYPSSGSSTLSSNCGGTPTVDIRVSTFYDWVRNATGLSLQYYDVVLNGSNGSIRATDASPATGNPTGDYVTPASVGSHTKLPKMLFNTSVDSWAVGATEPAGATLLSQAAAFGLNTALYGIYPGTYDRVLDTLIFTAADCIPAKTGRSIKCIGGANSVNAQTL